jgi:outer membrane protein assembly factor BamB
MKKNPVYIGKIDITSAGYGKGLIGDINGDGRMELVIVQPDGGIDDRYVPHQITCVTAYSLTGEMLWQQGTPSLEPGKFGSDFPAQIYDIDGDGKLEILCVMNKSFLILDGLTGEVKKSYDLPSDEAHDCIIIANLTGNETPRDIILKDRYENMWAVDNDFNLLWKHSGNLGHFPWAHDVNGDGYDEVMAGYDLLSHEGKILWSCKDLDDHADCLWVGDVNGDGKLEIAVGGSVTCLYDTEGNELWRYNGCIESQHIALGKFLENEPGLQIAGLDRIVRGDGHKGQWEGMDGMFLIDCNGKEVWKEKRTTKGWLTIVDTFSNWDGDGIDYILGYRRGGGVNPTLYNGQMEEVLSFPVDGYVLHGDLFGRGKEEIIIYNGDTAYIFAGTPCNLEEALNNKPIKQTKRLYASTLYPGGEYINKYCL